MSLTPIGDIGIALKADVDDYHKAVRTSRDLTGSLTSIVRGLGKAMRSTGILMTAAAGVAGMAMVTLSQRAQRVNSAFREVDTLVQNASGSQEKYGELVSDLNTKFGLQADRLEVIEGLYQSVSAGVDQAESSQREFLSTAAKLAVVGRVELGTSVDVLSTVMNTYGMETSMAQDVSEALFQTVQFGKTRLEDLAPVLGRVAALGSNLSVQIDEIGAAMGVLTRTGFGARVAATGLRNIFRSMLKPSVTMKQVMREIALDQDFFAEQMGESSDAVKAIADTYKDATSAIEEFSQKQKEQRDIQEEASLTIQEARLKMEAIEEGRLDQLPELTSEEVKNANSIEALEEVINNYQFTVNKARVEEEKYRQEKEEQESVLENVRTQFKEQVDAAGDLEGGIGQLVMENQGFVETLVEMKSRADESGIAMSELFPRTRALQGALALIGEDGQMLIDIFDEMENSTFSAQERWDEMDESVRKNFDSFEDFKSVTEDLKAGDLDTWFDEATGPQQEMRNSISRLNEAIADLGNVFSENVTDAISNFASSIERVVDKVESMEESVKGNISQFAILAVSLGLVLGPLLLFTGQIALIASAMGVMFIPFLAVAVGLISIFAKALSSAVSGGEESESVLGNLRNVFGGLIQYLKIAKNAFDAFITPKLVSFGATLNSLFKSLASSISGVVGGDSTNLTTIILDTAKAFGEAISVIDGFIAKNEDLIVKLVTLAVSVLVNKVIPAFKDLGLGIIAVIKGINWSVFAKIAIVIGKIALAIVPLIGMIGRWLQRNGKLIGKLITWGVIIGGIVVGLFKLIAIVGAVATTISGVVAGVQMAALAFYTASSMLGPLTVAFNVLASLFPSFTAGLSIISSAVGYLVSGLSLLVKGIMFLISGISLSTVAIGALIAILIAIVAYVWIARDNIVKAFKTLVTMWKDILNTLWDFITGEISWKEAGAKIVKALAKGITGALGHLKDGARKMAKVIGNYLPTSPAKKGYFSENPPKEIGAGISENVAAGMDLETDVGTNFDDLEGTEFDVESDMDTENFSQYSNSGVGKEIGKEKADVTFEEGAVKVGPFEGISDEELPGKVKEEVDRSLQDIVEEIEGAGQDSTEKF